MAWQFQDARTDAGLPDDLVLHCARHGFGTEMYRATKNLFAVKTALTRNRHGRGIGRGRQVVERMVSAEGIEPSTH